MLPRMRRTWASLCSCVSLPLTTSFAACPEATSRAFASPASTRRWSTSLRTTGMSAAAMTCAISPPITPAPTTAALNTNIARTLAALLALPLHVAAPLAGEARERPPQRRRDLATHEQHVDEPRERMALLELVVERQRDLDLVVPGLELDSLAAAQAAVLDLERLARARLERLHDLEHAPAPVRDAVPLQRALGGPAVGQLDHMTEAVDPGGPAEGGVPKLLGLRGQPRHGDRGGRAAHQRSTSSRIASIERTIRSRRGPSSAASRSRSARPASVIR